MDLLVTDGSAAQISDQIKEEGEVEFENDVEIEAEYDSESYDDGSETEEE